jgi:hypothetical protein
VADDLIPPPSPAGRPEPDSSDRVDRDRRDSGGGLWLGRSADADRVAMRRASAPARDAGAPVAGAPAGPPAESPYR